MLAGYVPTTQRRACSPSCQRVKPTQPAVLCTWATTSLPCPNTPLPHLMSSKYEGLRPSDSRLAAASTLSTRATTPAVAGRGAGGNMSNEKKVGLCREAHSVPSAACWLLPQQPAARTWRAVHQHVRHWKSGPSHHSRWPGLKSAAGSLTKSSASSLTCARPAVQAHGSADVGQCMAPLQVCSSCGACVSLLRSGVCAISTAFCTAELQRAEGDPAANRWQTHTQLIRGRCSPTCHAGGALQLHKHAVLGHLLDGAAHHLGTGAAAAARQGDVKG